MSNEIKNALRLARAFGGMAYEANNVASGMSNGGALQQRSGYQMGGMPMPPTPNPMGMMQGPMMNNQPGNPMNSFGQQTQNGIDGDPIRDMGYTAPPPFATLDNNLPPPQPVQAPVPSSYNPLMSNTPPAPMAYGGVANALKRTHGAHAIPLHQAIARSGYASGGEMTDEEWRLHEIQRLRRETQTPQSRSDTTPHQNPTETTPDISTEQYRRGRLGRGQFALASGGRLHPDVKNAIYLAKNRNRYNVGGAPAAAPTAAPIPQASRNISQLYQDYTGKAPTTTAPTPAPVTPTPAPVTPTSVPTSAPNPVTDQSRNINQLYRDYTGSATAPVATPTPAPAPVLATPVSAPVSATNPVTDQPRNISQLYKDYTGQAAPTPTNNAQSFGFLGAQPPLPFTQEAKNRQHDQFVRDEYQGLLGRDPTIPELQAAVAQLNKGTTQDQFDQNLAASEESQTYQSSNFPPFQVAGWADDGSMRPPSYGPRTAYQANKSVPKASQELQDYFAPLENQYSLPSGALLASMGKESTFGTNQHRAGSQYKGAFQLSPDLINGKVSGVDKVLNPYDWKQSARAAAQYMAQNSKTFKSKTGQEPQMGDFYGMHLQGATGWSDVINNPNGNAVKSLGYERVLQNLPDELRSQARAMTNAQFRKYVDVSFKNNLKGPDGRGQEVLGLSSTPATPSSGATTTPIGAPKPSSPAPLLEEFLREQELNAPKPPAPPPPPPAPEPTPEPAPTPTQPFAPPPTPMSSPISGFEGGGSGISSGISSGGGQDISSGSGGVSHTSGVSHTVPSSNTGHTGGITHVSTPSHSSNFGVSYASDPYFGHAGVGGSGNIGGVSHTGGADPYFGHSPNTASYSSLWDEANRNRGMSAGNSWEYDYMKHGGRVSEDNKYASGGSVDAPFTDEEIHDLLNYPLGREQGGSVEQPFTDEEIHDLLNYPLGRHGYATDGAVEGDVAFAPDDKQFEKSGSVMAEEAPPVMPEAEASSIQHSHSWEHLPLHPYGTRYNEETHNFNTPESKDIGFYGPVSVGEGDHVASEYSRGSDIGQYPSIAADMPEDLKVQALNAARFDAPVPEEADKFAYNKAAERKAQGRSPFYEAGKDPYPKWSPNQYWEKPAIMPNNTDALKIANKVLTSKKSKVR